MPSYVRFNAVSSNIAVKLVISRDTVDVHADGSLM